jgi:hypothetical protein
LVTLLLLLLLLLLQVRSAEHCYSEGGGEAPHQRGGKEQRTLQGATSL